ncbi:MAG: hypothetical protein C3F06_14250 [Candidatus Methanoperedenaceae archaeon]|nr:MAG: hypothetical protein C3F06_14250 [Candidatus Methanoperedenaceae archaeon]
MYEPHEIEISHGYLKTVISRLEEPICLIGGWAVYHHVNKNFKKRTGRNYIGSRDIDLGFHFEKDWSEKELNESTFARSLRIIEEELDFAPVGFRYLKEFHIETKKELNEDEVKTIPQHFVFPLYIDPIVDIIHPKFYKVFKFNPVDEPLLEMVFLNKSNRMVERSFGNNLWLPEPHILLATKLNSVIGRDKEHKRLKDIADIFALLWFSDAEISDIKSNLLEFYDRINIKKTIGSISKQEIINVATFTGFSPEEIERIFLEIAK